MKQYMKNMKHRKIVSWIFMLSIIGLGYLYMMFQTPTDYPDSPVDTDITYPLDEGE